MTDGLTKLAPEIGKKAATSGRRARGNVAPIAAGGAVDERLDAALANVPHGLCIYDAGRRLVICNPRYGEMYKLPPDLLRPGTRLEDIIAYRTKIGNEPLDFPNYATHEGIAFRLNANSVFQFRLRDGRSIRVNHLTLKEGGYVATHEDITEALRSEDRFRSIFNAVGDGIFIIDTGKNQLVDVNQQGGELLGCRTADLIGRDIEVLASGEPFTREALLGWLDRTVENRRPHRFEWRGKTASGRFFPVQISTSFASIAGRDVVLAVVRDQTELQAIEAQLRQAQKMEAVGQLTGGMAHDFNNLLAIIIGSLDFLIERMPDQPDLADLTREALEAALRGADLTQRLLAFARRQPLQATRIDLSELVQRVGRLLGRMLGEDIEITIDSGDGLWPVVVDPTQLEAALINIANNARDAMPKGGLLAIVTSNRTLDQDYAALHPGVAPGSYAVIEISDSGTGMSPEVLARIFEPFFTTKEKGKGTGLGLSMVFGFMKQSGGHVSVYSEPGIGTTFRLYLPRAAGVTAEAAPELGTAPDRGGHETILAVEDNRGLRNVVTRQLKELGYRLLQAEDGQGALRMLEAEPVDLLFTDIVMPGGISGYDLARAALARWPRLKVVLTSGFPEAKLNGNGDHVGHLKLLVKPYRKADLARVLREALDA